MLTQRWGILRTHNYDTKLASTVKSSFAKSISKSDDSEMSEKLHKVEFEVSLRDKDDLVYRWCEPSTMHVVTVLFVATCVSTPLYDRLDDLETEFSVLQKMGVARLTLPVCRS